MLNKTLLILLWFCLVCSGQEVGILAGTQRTGSAEQRELNLSSDRIAEVLRFLEIPFQRLQDDRLDSQQLQSLKVLFLPQNHILPAASAAALGDFVSQGGKLGVFYNSDPQVLRYLGIEKTRYVGRDDLGEVSGIQFAADAWKASPPFLRQRSGNLLEPVLTGDSSDRKVAGKFIRPDGTDSGRVGVLVHANGFYMSHVYLAQDRQGGSQFFLSFVGNQLPEYWHKAAQHKIAATGRIFGFSALPELQSWCEVFHSESKEGFAEAGKLLEQARQAVNLQ